MTMIIVIIASKIICTEHNINLLLQSNINTLHKHSRLVFVKIVTVLSMSRYNSVCSISREKS